MSQFDAAAVAEQISSEMIPKLESLGMPPEELAENSDILREFNKIAAGMLADALTNQTGIQMQGMPQPIPLNEKMAMQALSLFAEGVLLAVTKCLEMGITGDVKKHLLQNLAMHVYEQSQQIVASTFGQEHTPEFQFTHEQQVDFICQGTESALMHFITEFERQNGPIQTEAPATESQAESTEAPQAAPAPASPKASPTKPKGPTPHDKYGAVALLLNTLPAEQRTRLLKNFNDEEKELITYYSYPQHLEQNLDLACVQTHLKRFKEMLKQGGGTSLKSHAYHGIRRLAQGNPMEKLLSCVKDERPVVQQYVQSHYGDPEDEHLPYATGDSTGSSPRHLTELLPSRVEEILYRYLAKRLEPQTP